MSAEYMHIGIPITNRKPNMVYNEGGKFWVRSPARRCMRMPPPEIPKPRPGMNAILPQGGKTTTGRNRPRPKLSKPAKADTENARDNNSPWRFHHYCRSSKSIYF